MPTCAGLGLRPGWGDSRSCSCHCRGTVGALPLSPDLRHPWAGRAHLQLSRSLQLFDLGFLVSRKWPLQAALPMMARRGRQGSSGPRPALPHARAEAPWVHPDLGTQRPGIQRQKSSSTRPLRHQLCGLDGTDWGMRCPLGGGSAWPIGGVPGWGHGGPGTCCLPRVGEGGERGQEPRQGQGGGGAPFGLACWVRAQFPKI